MNDINLFNDTDHVHEFSITSNDFIKWLGYLCGLWGPPGARGLCVCDPWNILLRTSKPWAMGEKTGNFLFVCSRIIHTPLQQRLLVAICPPLLPLLVRPKQAVLSGSANLSVLQEDVNRGLNMMFSGAAFSYFGIINRLGLRHRSADRKIETWR